MKLPSSWLKHNIATEILSLAIGRPGLQPYGTGGGCDYIVRFLDPEHGDDVRGPVMVLGTDGDAGSPEKIDDTDATVTLYLDNDDWADGGYMVFKGFEEVAQALDFMSGFERAEVVKPTEVAQ